MAETIRPRAWIRPRRTLRNYLGALVLLFLLTELVGTAYARGQAEDAARQNAAASAQFSAKLAASEVDAALASLESSIARTAAAPGIVAAFDQITACNLVFGAVGVFQRTHLDLLRSDGSVACSSMAALPADVGYASAAWLAGAMQSATFAAPILDPRTGGRSAVSAAPVRGHGAVAGFADLAGLGPLLATRFGGPLQLEFLVTTADGRSVIARSIDPDRWAGASLANTPFQVAADAPDARDLDGVARIYGQAPVGARGWTVFAGVTRDAALAAVSSTVLADVAVSSAMLLLLLVASLLVYRAITFPISQLARSVRAGAASGHIAAVPVRGPKEVAGLAEDVNALIATATAELAERERAEALARGMLDASLDAVVGMDEHGVIVEWNHQADLIFGWDRPAAVGARLADLIIPTRYRERHSAGLAHFLRTGVGPVLGKRVELEGLARDGREFPVELAIAPVSTSAGQFFSASIRDLTPRRDAERIRVELEARLRQAQRLETVGQLAGGVAHDFNNLLAVILNYAEFVLDKLPEGGTRKDVEEIRRAASRGADLTKQLLMFARQDLTKPELLDINVVVSRVEDLLRRTLGENITFEMRLATHPPAVRADVGQLEHVLLNLAVNARDAMPNGGRLLVETAVVEIDETFSETHPGIAPGRYVRLSVSDTGVGMTREVAARAFEPFFTTKPSGEGTGLGLATIYGIVTQAGGGVRIYSEEGRGTLVAIDLPAVAEPADPLRRDEVSTARAGGTGQVVLIVEDEPAVLVAADRILGANGYEVLARSTPAAALVLLADHTRRIDVLLTDVVMPEMSGAELVGRARALRAELSVLYMSGYSTQMVERQGPMQLGDKILQKPFTRSQLLDAVRHALGGRDG